MSANQRLLAHLCGLALVIVLKLLRTVPITFDSSPVNNITSPISVPTTRMSSSPLLSSVLWTQLSVIIDTLITIFAFFSLLQDCSPSFFTGQLNAVLHIVEIFNTFICYSGGAYPFYPYLP